MHKSKNLLISMSDTKLPATIRELTPRQLDLMRRRCGKLLRYTQRSYPTVMTRPELLYQRAFSDGMKSILELLSKRNAAPTQPQLPE